METTTAKIVNKYSYFKVIQYSYNGATWDDCSQYETDSQGGPKEYTKTKEGKSISLLRADFKEYTNSHGGGFYRIIFRKELNK